MRDALRELGKPYGLVDGDYESRAMGQNGSDVILSPSAKRLIDLNIEAKAQQNLNVIAEFTEHFNKYPDGSTKLLVHRKNHLESKIDDFAVVTLRFKDFIALLQQLLSFREKAWMYDELQH